MIRLTPQERRVVEQALEGAGDAEIARALTISVWTVRTYLRRVADRLDPDLRPRLAFQRHGERLGLG